jgi:hypothetical protein
VTPTTEHVRGINKLTGTVPVTRDGLGLQGHLGAELFSDTVEKETGDPQVVTHLDTLARADLEFPLGGHDLGVGARDLDTGVQASLVVGLDDVSADDLTSTDTTVVRTLGRREAVLGPAVWVVIHIEEGVLLLQTEPWLVLGVGLHELGTLVAVVVLVRGAIGHPRLGENENVGYAAHRIGEDGNRPQVDIRVVAGGLVRRGTIEIPDGQILGLELAIFGYLGDSLNKGGSKCQREILGAGET